MVCQLKDAKTDDYKIFDILTEDLIGKSFNNKGYIKNHYQNLCGKEVCN